MEQDAGWNVQGIKPSKIILIEARQPGQGWYASILRPAVYGLWAGNMSFDNFIVSFTDAVWIGLQKAWVVGAGRAGIKPDEMTDAEIAAMQTGAFNQLQYIPGFGQFIMSQSKANGGKLSTCIHRMGLWVNKWNMFETQGYMMAKLDQKLRWDLGATDNHCGSCVKLAGKVKRASQWLAANIFPQSHDLECKGFLCQCSLNPTDEPMSKGRLPKLP